MLCPLALYLCRPFGDLSHLVTLALLTICRPFGDLMLGYVVLALCDLSRVGCVM